MAEEFKEKTYWFYTAKECSNCGQELDDFFFPHDEDICSECTDHLQKALCKRAFFERVLELEGKILGKYVKAITPVVCLCGNMHPCNPTPSSIQQGHGMCRICTKNDPITARINFFQNIKNKGGIVIGEYVNAITPVDCLCGNMHPCNPTPGNIQQGNGMCQTCSGLDSILPRINFIRKIEEQGGIVIGEYTTSGSPTACKCKNGHDWYPTPNHIQQGDSSCLICIGRDAATIERNFIQNVENQGGIVFGKYSGADERVKCICKNNHVCYPAPHKVQQGFSICSKCRFKTEALCREILEESINCEITKIKPEWLRWKTGYLLELDGYNEEKKIAFEYQGPQHERYIPYYHRNGPSDFEAQVARDNFKKKICVERGIFLLCIPSKYTFDKPIELCNFILETLMEAGIIV